MKIDETILTKTLNLACK